MGILAQWSFEGKSQRKPNNRQSHLQILKIQLQLVIGKYVLSSNRENCTNRQGNEGQPNKKHYESVYRWTGFGNARLPIEETVFFFAKENGMHRNSLAIMMTKITVKALIDSRTVNNRMTTVIFYSMLRKLILTHACASTNVVIDYTKKEL